MLNLLPSGTGATKSGCKVTTFSGIHQAFIIFYFINVDFRCLYAIQLTKITGHLRVVPISPIARSDGLYSSFQYLLYPPKDYPDESQMTSEHLVGTIWTTRSCHRNLFAMAKVRHPQTTLSASFRTAARGIILRNL